MFGPLRSSRATKRRGITGVGAHWRACDLGIDPDVPAYRLRTGERLLGRSVARRRVPMTLISSFAAIALVLALLGLHGVLAYGVAQRTREIGIRTGLRGAAGQVLGEWCGKA
jgi:putative ABC transport system permease protein